MYPFSWIKVIKNNLKILLRMPAHTHTGGMKNKMGCLRSFQVPNPVREESVLNMLDKSPQWHEAPVNVFKAASTSCKQAPVLNAWLLGKITTSRGNYTAA